MPGLAGDVPGGGVVPVDNGTVPGEVGPVMLVVTDGTNVVTVKKEKKTFIYVMPIVEEQPYSWYKYCNAEA